MNSINIAACIVAFLLGVVLFTLANEIILKLPNNENIFKGKPKSFEKFSPRCLFIQILGGVFGVLMVWQFDVSLEAVTVFLFFALLTIITFIDADTMEIPFVLIVLVIPDGFGGGDIKLMFAAGFFLGWKATVIAFFIGLIIGGCQGVILLARRKKGKDDHFAFGPALSVGLMIATFVGSQMMNSYINMIKASFYA